MHNTVVDPSSDEKSESAPESEPQADEETPAAINTDDYLTEQEYERQAEQDRQENPQFYTWVDEQGHVRNQGVPQADESEEAQEPSLLNVTDHTLVKPLRLRAAVQNAGCCQSYSGFFKQTLVAEKSYVFTKPQFSQHFYTQSGNQPAWFFNLPAFDPTENSAAPVLKLRLRGTDQPLALVALDQHWQPLYAIGALQSQYYPETWRTVAMHESLLSVADAEVTSVIVYFPQGVENTANLEVFWLPQP